MTLEHFKYVKPKDSISNFCWRPPPFDTIETGLLSRERGSDAILEIVVRTQIACRNYCASAMPTNWTC